jgi:ABC-type nitrate/sulfonate/bicarbonate transport system ATPase subunit
LIYEHDLTIEKTKMGINVSNLTFSYENKIPILNNISIKTGCRSIGIVGTSGSGKSTLLRLLCGLISKNKNNILEGNITIDDQEPSALVKSNKIGFMFQEDALLPNLTVARNVKLPLILQHHSNFRTAEEYIKKVGLEADVMKLPSELSGGMRTRVALARTFVVKPSVLLLDEPFTGLDEYWKSTLYKELESLRSEINPFTALVTHQIEEALLLSNHIFVLGRRGIIIKDFIIDKKLPRVFSLNALNDLQDMHLEIKELIINDANENEKVKIYN